MDELVSAELFLAQFFFLQRLIDRMWFCRRRERRSLPIIKRQMAKTPTQILEQEAQNLELESFIFPLTGRNLISQ